MRRADTHFPMDTLASPCPSPAASALSPAPFLLGTIGLDTAGRRPRGRGIA
jgi:hypothetical protein